MTFSCCQHNVFDVFVSMYFFRCIQCCQINVFDLIFLFIIIKMNVISPGKWCILSHRPPSSSGQHCDVICHVHQSDARWRGEQPITQQFSCRCEASSSQTGVNGGEKFEYCSSLCNSCRGCTSGAVVPFF